MEYYLAVDIGASSGRHMLCSLSDGKLTAEEVYRFKNGASQKGGYAVWDHEGLVREVIAGMKKCAELGKIPSYMAIDTWGVDYALLDGNDRIIGDTIAYRDKRTNGMDKELEKLISSDELYKRTGIQKQLYNTIYQLLSVNLTHPEWLASAETMLMTPDYLNFRLTGVKHQEYTMASTSQLLSLETNGWDYDLIKALGFPEKLFTKLYLPGETVGKLSSEIADEIGYDLTVLHAASHDTASAVLAMPSTSEDAVYLSSGTWSLIGIETAVPHSDELSKQLNYTNEGGYGYRYRYLKNIMGLWIIQSIRHELGDEYSFNDLSNMADAAKDTKYRINVNDWDFLAPDSMIDTVKAHIGVENVSVGELIACVYHSLADSYAESFAELSERKGKKLTALHIIGGGSKDSFLNSLTAEKTGVTVISGPTEATAIGNVISQMLGTKAFSSLDEARRCVYASFPVKETIGK